MDLIYVVSLDIFSGIIDNKVNVALDENTAAYKNLSRRWDL